MNEKTEVTVRFMDGPEGKAWYAWETEYPDEGYFYVGNHKPTADELIAICETYVDSEGN